jgi:Uma2 family endonuclease
MSTAIEARTLDLLSQADDTLYEIIEGKRVEKLMGIRQILLANRLAFYINQLAFTPRLGIAVVEALFDLGLPDSPQFRPDLAFISEERWARDRDQPEKNAWAVVPDLVVEVVSPSNSADEIQGKVDVYLQAGVRVVWVVYMKSFCVHIFDGSASIGFVKRNDDLDGGKVIPGFRLPLRALLVDNPVTEGE